MRKRVMRCTATPGSPQFVILKESQDVVAVDFHSKSGGYGYVWVAISDGREISPGIVERSFMNMAEVERYKKYKAEHEAIYAILKTAAEQDTDVVLENPENGRKVHIDSKDGMVWVDGKKIE